MEPVTIKVLCLWTDRSLTDRSVPEGVGEDSSKTVQIRIRLLRLELSYLGLHCLLAIFVPEFWITMALVHVYYLS